ncbi:hypothetical protein ANO11243_054270 [Dothideomycetidae sp. 11243]|nr:hypothetical protein ANO11243_054270 [fungal sp. No.11243]
MRLPYAPSTPPPSAPPSTKETYDRITARRAPRPLQSLDLALLHAPPVASGWNSFLGAIRGETTLPQASIMELAICRVAVLNRAAYEWDAHSALAVKGEDGLSELALRAVLDAEEFVGQDVGDRLRELKREGKKDGLEARQWVVLAFTDQMTRNVQVDDRVWELVRQEFDERQCVELTATIAAYNCVSRFLAALDVGERNGGKMEMPKRQ